MPRADFTLIVLAASSAAFGLALAALLRSGKRSSAAGRSRPPRLAWLLIAGAVGWAAAVGLERLHALGLARGLDPAALERFQWYAILAQALAFVLLTRLFQRRSPVERQAPAAYTLDSVPRLLLFYAPALWLLAGAVLHENWIGLPDLLFQVGQMQVHRWDAARAWLLLGELGCLAWAGLLIARDYRRYRAPLHRNRTNYWAVALGLLSAGHLLGLAGAAAAAAPLQMLGALAAAYAFATHHLADLRSAARTAGMILILGAAALSFYGLAYAVLTAALRLIPGDPARQQWIALGAALALGGAAVLLPLVRWLRGLLRRWFYGARYDPRQTLAEYSASISNVLELEVLSTISIGLISEALEIARGALITVEPLLVDPAAYNMPAASLPDALAVEGAEVARAARSASSEMPTLPHQGYRLRPITGMGETLPEGTLAANSPAASSLRRERLPLTQFDLDLHPRYQAMQPEERAWWSSLQMDVYVPIYVKETWIGLLALGPKVSGDRYYDEDLTFLQTLADQTSVAFENARLFAHLKQRNAENERLNAELTAANVELSRLDQAKSNFINIASHELRTPLTQIMGYNDILAEMVRFELSVPDALPMTEAVRKAARRLEEIVDRMFDVSKLDTRTLDLHMDLAMLSPLVSAAGDAWRAGMEERGLRLALRGLDGLPAVRGDAQRLTQVFANLIQNAIRATPDGGMIVVSGQAWSGAEPEADAEPEAGESNGKAGWVEVVVADTGIGIEPDELERIFTKFYRVGNVLLHSTGETKFKGAGPGLGLTIARGIVEAHGGRIWAESPGRDETACPGSRFHVLLPAAEEERD